MNASPDYTQTNDAATWTVHENGIPYGDYRYEEAKRMLLGVEQHRYDPRFVRRFGPAAALMASQLLYWDGKQHDAEGWIYKTHREWQEETGLSRRQQDKGRKVLKGAGVLYEKEGYGPDRRMRTFYHLDFLKLLDVMDTLSGNSEQGSCPPSGEQAPPYSNTGQDIHRLHPQTTSEIPLSEAGKPAQKESERRRKADYEWLFEDE